MRSSLSKTLAVVPAFLRSENDLYVTAKALATLRASTSDDQEILVVDDKSPAEDQVVRLRKICSDQDIGLIERQENSGFATTVNVGLRQARDNGQNAVLVNADIEFIELGWLERMEAREESVVGALLLYPMGLIQHAGVFFSVITRTFDHIYRLAPGSIDVAHVERICPVTGALMFIQHECLVNVGILDENFSFSFEDVSYCHEVFSSGRLCVYDPKVKAIHHESLFSESESEGDEIFQRRAASWLYLLEKHKGLVFDQHIPTLMPDLDEVVT
jgi:GT2 family glycosyltransferase